MTDRRASSPQKREQLVTQFLFPNNWRKNWRGTQVQREKNEIRRWRWWWRWSVCVIASYHLHCHLTCERVASRKQSRWMKSDAQCCERCQQPWHLSQQLLREAALRLHSTRSARLVSIHWKQKIMWLSKQSVCKLCDLYHWPYDLKIVWVMSVTRAMGMPFLISMMSADKNFTKQS